MGKGTENWVASIGYKKLPTGILTSSPHEGLPTAPTTVAPRPALAQPLPRGAALRFPLFPKNGFFLRFTFSMSTTNSNTAPTGDQGEKKLAAGQHVALRLWENEQPGDPKPVSTSPYETVGYVLKGRAELHLEGQVTVLEPGTSYLVPQGASHTYKILESFSAVEATSPPAK